MLLRSLRRWPGVLALATIGVLAFAACGDDDGANAKVGEQLGSAFNAPAPMKPAMPDHRFMAVGDGTYMFLHYDKPAKDATKLLYTGVAVPGKFTKAEQQRVEQQYGKGFTHFHRKDCASDNADACHGGDPGQDGYWFRHVAVDSFKMPWGDVKPGTDTNFMPTPPPQ